MKSSYNEDNDELYCVWCKERIHLYDKFITVTEDYCGDKIKKTYHPECLPEVEDWE